MGVGSGLGLGSDGARQLGRLFAREELDCLEAEQRVDHQLLRRLGRAVLLAPLSGAQPREGDRVAAVE